MKQQAVPSNSYAVYKRQYTPSGNVFYSYHDGPHESMSAAREIQRRFYKSDDASLFIIGVNPEREVFRHREQKAARRKAKRRTPKRPK